MFFLTFTLFLSTAFVNSNVSFAAGDTTIHPDHFFEASTNLGMPKDLSFNDNNFLVLSSDSDVNFRYFTTYNSTADGSSIEKIDLDIEASFLAWFNDSYFYATSNKVFRDGTEIMQSFTDISDLITSYKSLFLIDNVNLSLTKIYKFNEDTGEFDFYRQYNKKITKFCYNEVSKTAFAYDGQDIFIDGSVTKKIAAQNAADIICDFEGNLFIFQEAGNIKYYTYNSDYQYNENFILEFGVSYTMVLSVVLVQANGNFIILMSYNAGLGPVYCIFAIKNSPVLNVVTADDQPDIDFGQMELFNLNQNFENFYVAKITDYPSNRLYPADIHNAIGASIVPSSCA